MRLRVEMPKWGDSEFVKVTDREVRTLTQTIGDHVEVGIHVRRRTGEVLWIDLSDR